MVGSQSVSALLSIGSRGSRRSRGFKKKKWREEETKGMPRPGGIKGHREGVNKTQGRSLELPRSQEDFGGVKRGSFPEFGVWRVVDG